MTAFQSLEPGMTIMTISGGAENKEKSDLGKRHRRTAGGGLSLQKKETAVRSLSGLLRIIAY